MTLSEYIAEHSMSISVFATKVGVPASTISRVLSRKRDPGLDLLRKIMEATDGAVTPNDFLPPIEHAAEPPFPQEAAQ